MLLAFAVILMVSGLKANRCPKDCAGIDRNGDEACDKHTLDCLEGCKVGFYGNTCNSTCDVNCLNKSCQQNKGVCICRKGYHSLMGKCKITKGTRCVIENGHCKENTCKSGGRQQCLYGCVAGWFGEFCDKNCSKSCVCDQESGNCTGCVTGWFGAECESPCSSECHESNCHRNGSCVKGCKPGSYGERCELKCSQHCVSGCDQLSGECVQCEAGWFGRTCQSACSAGCAWFNTEDGTCDRTTGQCTGISMPYVIGGGVILIFLVLGVLMACCLQRIRDVMKDGVDYIGQNTALQSVQDNGTHVRSVDIGNSEHHNNGSRKDDTYNHLFDIKPIDATFSLADGDLETSSGYTAVRPLFPDLSDQLMFKHDVSSDRASDEESLVSLCGDQLMFEHDVSSDRASDEEGLVSLCGDQQESGMDEETVVVEIEHIIEPMNKQILHSEEEILNMEPIPSMALQPDKELIKELSQKLALMFDQKKQMPKATQIETLRPDEGSIVDIINNVKLPSDTEGICGNIVLDDEDEVTGRREAIDGCPDQGLGNKETGKDDQLEVEDCTNAVFL